MLKCESVFFSLKCLFMPTASPIEHDSDRANSPARGPRAWSGPGPGPHILNCFAGRAGPGHTFSGPGPGRVFFSGVYSWLVMTFNNSFCELGLWVRVNVWGSVNSNHNHNPKHIYNPNPNPTLTLTLTLNLP